EPLFEFLSTSGSSEDDENGIDIAALIASIGEAKTRRKVLDILRKEAAAIMRIAPMEIDADRPLSEMGFDSLMGMNLKLAIEERLGTVTQMNSIADGMTLAHLAALIVKSAGTADEISATENMAERHLTEIDLPEVLKRKISSDAST
ncbi:MAG: acyl carrier protein, partial [Pseudomonadota bacterium]